MTFEIEDSDPVFDIQAECIGETEKAILVRMKGFPSNEWIPLSVVDDDSEVYGKHDKGTLVIQEWFAVKQGWL